MSASILSFWVFINVNISAISFCFPVADSANRKAVTLDARDSSTFR